MKKINFLLLGMAIVALFLFSSNCSVAQNQQKETTGWYIETTKFAQYASKGKETQNIIYRYDKAGHLSLYFSNMGDTLINVFLYDYDNMGNLLQKNVLSLVKDEERYICIKCIYTADKFKEITQKILDRLDNK